MKPLFPEDLDHILRLTAPHWPHMRGEHLFVTGGTGFFGKWLVESFLHANRELALGARITVLSRDPARFAAACPWLTADPALLLLRGDVRDFAFPEAGCRFVIHAATEASAALLAADPAEMFSTQLAGTTRLLDFAAQAGAQKLLLTSSGAVYGRQPADVTHVPETYEGAPDPCTAASAYGEGKRVTELLGALAAHTTPSLEIKIARCFAFLGPHLPLDTHFAAGNFLGAALRGEPLRIAGDGTPLRSYLYAADLTVWLWTLLFTAPSLRPYNVGSEHAVNIRELADQAASLVEPRLPVRVAKEPIAGAPPSQYVPSTARARDELGLREYIALPEALTRTYRWHREL